MQNYRKQIDSLLSRADLLKRSLKQAKEYRQKAQEAACDAEEALQVAQTLSAQLQRQAQSQLSTIATRCLQAIFDEPYQLQIQFEEKRSKTEARLVLERDGLEVDPMTAAGGGVVDVVAFALRLAALILARPVRRRLVVADEPFRFVSKHFRARIRSLLETLAEEYKFQFIIVTHFEDLQIGSVKEL